MNDSGDGSPSQRQAPYDRLAGSPPDIRQDSGDRRSGDDVGTQPRFGAAPSIANAIASLRNALASLRNALVSFMESLPSYKSEQDSLSRAIASRNEEQRLSLRAQLAKALLVKSLKNRKLSIASIREQAARGVGLATALKGDVVTEELRLGGVRTLKVSPKEPVEGRAVFHLHGGGYVWGSPENHLPLLAPYARVLGATIYAPDYRLAPEHSFPAALDDALEAWRYLSSHGVDPRGTVLSGDSAGGGLALATGLSLRDAGESLPFALVLMSPWTDLTCSSPSHRANAATEVMLDTETLTWWASLYVSGRDPRDPLVSPAFADYRGMPPMIIQAGQEEILLDDARAVAEAAEMAGTPVKLSVRDSLWHAWQLLGDLMPESIASLEEIKRFLLDLERSES